MNYTRKQFVQTGTLALTGLGLAPLLRDWFNDEEARKLKRFGLQLYTVRDVFEKDPQGTLRQIATMGYKQIEGYERNAGLFWGMTNKEFKTLMDELGMDFISSHCDAGAGLEKRSAEAAAIGMKYLIHAWEGPGKSIDDYKKLADDFNRWGAVCKKNGIRFAFHNHYFSFEKQDGQVPQQVLLDNTDPELVDYELDMYWAYSAGQDPAWWMNKYPGRFKLCHIKDRVKGSSKREDTCDLGTGEIDYPTILKAARKHGMDYFIAEQEHYPDSTPMKSTAANAVYMRKLKI